MMIPTRLRLCQALALAGVMSAAMAAPTPGARTYIVQLANAPVTAYSGGTAGLASTKVAAGKRLDVNSASVRAYRAHLGKEHQAALAAVGGKVNVLHKYDLTFNGFSAVMTEAQAAQLKASGKALSVVPDEVRHADTLTTSHFLGLDAPNGVWNKQLRRTKTMGENIVIAVIDSGIQPENPAFYDRVNAAGVPVKTGGTLAYGAPPASWKGSCASGPGFVNVCNNKLIGARVFSTGFKAAVAAGAITPFFGDFYDVPRDEVGHGTHTLSTAGGNMNAPAVISTGVNIGATSGIAPRARLATYKALFGKLDAAGALGGSGFTSDLVAAIDTAVADGVDVINYSVSGSQTNLLDPVEVAFFNASSAGVFVAASAGNSGPGNQVAHPSPWITTVAATTHDRQFIGDLMADTLYTGATANQTALPATQMVLAENVMLATAALADAQRCFANTLDPALAAGKLVLCDRGVSARVDKGAEVKRAGGAGMVLVNTSSAADDIVADFHVLPAVHLKLANRAALRAHASVPGNAGSLSVRRLATGVVAPVMASFSSRGPNLATPNIMKPDIGAPGVDVIASVSLLQSTQAQHDGILAGTFSPSPIVESYQGTSMAAPHVAGVAALIMQNRPEWTPGMIKSAMMTTAKPVKLASGATDTNPNGYGAGNINPNGAVDPGLVYPVGTIEYLRYLCDTNLLAAGSGTCNTYGSAPAADLNLASFSLDVPGAITANRRVQNVGSVRATYTATASVPGFDVQVSPASLTLSPGEAANFAVTLTRTTAVVGARVFGGLNWTDGTHNVTSPITARAVNFTFPALISSTATSGTKNFRLGYAFTGSVSNAAGGLVGATRTASTIATGGWVCKPFTVPSGNIVVRAALYDAETSGNGLDDLDLYIVNDAETTSYGSSLGATSNEAVTLASMPAGNYKACVDGYAPNGGSSNFTLSTWVVGDTDTNPNFSVTGLPTNVNAGDTVQAVAAWSGLSGGVRYLGGVRYMNGATRLGTTLVVVEPASVASTQTPEPATGKVKRVN